MKKISVIFTLMFLFLLTSTTFPMSLQFDFNGGDQVWDTERTMSIGETVQVDVWLDGYDLVSDVTAVGFEITYDDSLNIIDCSPYVQPQGCWSPTDSYADCGPGEDNLYAVFSPGFPSSGCEVVEGKVKLHTIVLQCISGGDNDISTKEGFVFDIDQIPYLLDDASATIHGPCIIEIVPESSDGIRPNATIQFNAIEEGNCNEPTGLEWQVTAECGSSINASGLYTAGDVDADCTDTVTVKDVENLDIQATATVNITPFLTITPQNPTTGSGSRIIFKGVNNGFCEVTPVYSWSVESKIGSIISEGNTVNAKGDYQAGRNFTSCEDAIDTVVLTADCNGTLKTVDTTVTVAPCVVTISPKHKEIEPGETIQFKVTPSNECCENDPCYTWSVSAEGTTGNTVNVNTSSSNPTSGAVIVGIQSIGAPVYTWAMGAAGNTGNTSCGTIDGKGLYRAGQCTGTDIVTVTDTCNNNATDTAVVDISTSSTTTTIPRTKECLIDKDCDDGSFCNGQEQCISFNCQPGDKPCADDGLYCNGDEGCDEKNGECIHSGDPCEPDLTCVEDNDVCTGCLDDADCDDGLYCNGPERCVDNVCQQAEPVACEDDGLYCSGVEVCDETKDACVHSGFPCAQPTPICNEFENTCEEIPTIVPSILVEPDLVQSHLIPLPAFLTITGQDGAQFDSSSTVSYNPANALWALPPLVLDNENIFVLGLLMPLWMTGSLDTVEVTVITDSQEATGNFSVTLLPFILGDEREQ